MTLTQRLAILAMHEFLVTYNPAYRAVMQDLGVEPLPPRHEPEVLAARAKRAEKA